MTYSVGLQNVGSYQVSGRPWSKTLTVTDGAQQKIELPNVSKKIRIKKQSSSGSVKVAFADSGILSRALDFLNNSDRFEVNFAGTGTLSVSFWINFTGTPSGGEQRAIELKTTSSFYTLTIRNTVGTSIRFRLYVDGTSTNQSPGYLATVVDVGNLNSWHNITIARNGDSNSLYLNGTLLATNVTPSNDTTGITIAGASAGFAGIYDEMTFWDKELSSQEVSELYNGGVFIDPTTHSAATDLASWWSFEDNANGTIVSTPDTTDTIFDRVSSNNLIRIDGGTPGPDVAFVDAQSSWRIFNGQQTNVLSGLHFLTLEGDDAIELPVKCKEIYLTADGADVDLDVFASLTNIPSSRMFDLTGPGINE
jgi:hypothetical protein